MAKTAPNAGDVGSIPGQITRSYMPQLRVHMWERERVGRFGRMALKR